MTGRPTRDPAQDPAADPGLEDAVRAMGHPGRRAMLTSARDHERTATELAQAAGLSAAAASQHLKVLRETGLLLVRADAQRRLYRVDFARLAQVRAVLDAIWADRLDALAAVAESDEQDAADGGPSRGDTRRGSA